MYCIKIIDAEDNAALLPNIFGNSDSAMQTMAELATEHASAHTGYKVTKTRNAVSVSDCNGYVIADYILCDLRESW